MLFTGRLWFQAWLRLRDLAQAYLEPRRRRRVTG